jgi:hypothetical protein
MWKLIKEEPVALQTIIQAALALAISFGAKLSGGNVGAILAVSAAVLGFVTRKAVTPTANPKMDDGTPLVIKPAAARERAA